jgi:hypothetical protein
MVTPGAAAGVRGVTPLVLVRLSKALEPVVIVGFVGLVEQGQTSDRLNPDAERAAVTL